MPFSDPSSGFYSPNMPSGGPVDVPNLRLQPIPDVANIGSPTRQPFERVQAVRYEPDETLAVGLKAGANALRGAVEGVDNAIKLSLASESNKEVSSILAKQIEAGLDTKEELMTSQSQSVLDQTPEQLLQGMNKLTTLKKAQRSGAMSDTDFRIRVNEVAASMKNRFPGYASWIDNKIDQELQTNAGALRQSIQKDIDAIQRAQQSNVDYWTKHFNDNRNDLPGDYMKRTVGENLAILHQVQSGRQAKVDATATMKQMEEQGVHPWQIASNEAARIGVHNGAIMLQTMIREIKSNGGDVDAFLSGKVTDPEQIKIATSALRQAQLAWERQFDHETTVTPYGGDHPGRTLFNILRASDKAKELDDIKKRTNPFAPLLEAINNKDWGSAKAIARDNEAITDARRAQIFANQDLLTHSVLSKDLGPVYPVIVANNSKISKSIANPVNDLFNRKFLDPKSPLSERVKDFYSTTKYETGNKPSAGEVNQKLDNIITVLSSDQISNKKFQEDHYRSVYNDPDNGLILEGVKKAPNGVNSALSLYNRFIQPDITRKALSMPNDVKEGYINWAKQNASRVLPGIVDDIRGNAANNAYFDIKWDAKTSAFVAVPTNLGNSNKLGYDEGLNRGWFYPSVNTKLDKLNATLQSLKPIVEATGQDFNEYVQTSSFLHIAGVEKTGLEAIQQTNREAVRARYNRQTPTNTDTLLNLIVRGESDGSYDASNYNKSYLATTKTVGEVLEDQKNFLKTRKDDKTTTASGGPQFIYETLDKLVKQTGIDLKEKFTPELQNKLARELIKGRGLSDYLAGKISEDDFADNLANEWAALPLRTGKSKYDGDKQSNKARVNRQELLAAIRATDFTSY